jgi:hypothetical protein
VRFSHRPESCNPLSFPMISSNVGVAALGKWMHGVVLCAVLLTGCSEGTTVAGKAEFETANKLIGVSSGDSAFGDSPTSQAAAVRFSKSMKTMQGMMFSGGSGRSLATKGEFLTYVRHTDQAVVVLCHVPELRNYKDASVRESLASLAWLNAQMAAATLPGVKPSHTLIVGLRGFASYGPIWEGPVSGEPVKKTDSGLERKRLHPFFAPVVTVAPATPAPVEPVATPAL